ncbi:MAG: hypothetical protein A3F61_02115 [Candidatus Blackburnbacteria bacterium RIFCSPHIGHO2_12_FULL_41_13b]|uniref:Type II secretion system protein GspG C-terminal domain-containing protein n=1 Tax=Candidatus Blackburnbacteria bacterium RIFCSPHIGHO2_12_FULL_41_13b TaxID=1797517 RepID=A0A1G1V442_9BACT|nr:MAG: hypothetical protein A3F61_02115 [Candidatus Blackburnbacteria bacterium RIFCSPHIGHO2_12_FULL_41_13b]
MEKIKGFSKIRLIFGIAFLALIFSAFYSQYNPVEKTKQKNDNQNTEYAKSILSAFLVFYQDTGRMPWTDDFGSEKGATPLMFTQITEAPVGICKDILCASPGEMAVNVSALYPIPLGAKNIFIGKGSSNSDPTYACFVPESENIREKTGSLYRIEELKKKAFAGDLPSCGDNIDWKDESCYVCIK